MKNVVVPPPLAFCAEADQSADDDEDDDYEEEFEEDEADEVTS